MVWSIDGPQGNESAKIKWELVPYTRGRVLDLGCGPFKAFPHFIGVDNGHHDRQFGWQNKADLIVDDCEKLDLIASQSVDAVFSSHLLEHIEDHKKALAEWWRVIKPGGYLCLYLPHKDFYPNIGETGANPDHKHDFEPADIMGALRKIGVYDLVENQERNDGNEYSFFQVFKKLTSGVHRYSYQHKVLKGGGVKKAAVVRYGAFGDLIQASSVFPALKAQGYHITLYTTTKSHEVVKHDPNIDQFIVQDRDQVPNAELGDFWDYESKKYDRFINLSESVEGSLLAMPSRMNSRWPDSVRRKYLDVNYLEFVHELAEVPGPYQTAFYPTDDEIKWAQREYQKLGACKIIMWVLAGSSMHKTYPHLDAVVARLMLADPCVKVLLVGDEACKILEQGWENEPRVIRRSGIWSIRETLAFLPHCAVVAGCETGVINAAGMMTIPTVTLLSHSSENNLTKHWINNTSICPPTACHPCHRMHYDFRFCIQDDESGCAKCQVDILPDRVFDAINEGLKQWRRAAA